MFTLRGRKDQFRLLFPKEFICDEIVEKYTNILKAKHSFITTPIDFLNETIQSVQVLGFNEGVVQQMQTNRGTYSSIGRDKENNFLHTATDYNYRSEVSPIALIDKTLNVTFRHTLGFVNYFLIFENFFYQYQRDTGYDKLIPALYIDILDDIGNIYSRIEIQDPIISGIDMLDYNYTQPTAQSDTFKVEFKYSNFDFQFITDDENTIDKESLNLITP